MSDQSTATKSLDEILDSLEKQQSTPSVSAPITPTPVTPPPSAASIPTPVATVSEAPVAPPTPAPTPAPTPEPVSPPSSPVTPVVPPEAPHMEEKKVAVQKAKNNSFMVALIGGVVCLLLIVGVVAFFSMPKTAPTPTPTPIAKSTVRPTASPVAVATPTPIPQPGTEAPRTTGYASLPKMPTSTNPAKVAGLVCVYNKQQVAGTAVFYEVNKKAIATTSVAVGKQVYATSIPAGSYIAIFYPKDLTLPPFGFTQYVQCGLDPAKCTNHAPLVMTIAAGKQYGQIDLCDPQMVYQGLPNELHQ